MLDLPSADKLHDIASFLGVDYLMSASFNGIEFDCLFTRDTLAKDTVTYAYPYRDGEEVEDQGLKAVNFRIQAIFWGSRYQTKLKAFLNALKTTGTGELVHPIYGSLPDVQFLEAGVFHEVEPVNAVTVDLVFVESGKPDALFATTHFEVDGDSLFGSAMSWFGKAMDTLHAAQQAIARVTSIIGTAQFVVSSLANEIRSTIGSVLNFLDYPTAFISSLKNLTGAFTERLSLNELSGVPGLSKLGGASHSPSRTGLTASSDRATMTAMTTMTTMSDWSALVALKDTMLALPEQYITSKQVISADGAFSTTLRRDIVMPVGDAEMLTQAIRLVAISEMLDTAGDIFVNESRSPTCSPADIERITGEVRSLIVDAIRVQRNLISRQQKEAEPAQVAEPDTRHDYAVITALQDSAWLIQEQARGLILALPPLTQRQVVRRCNLPLLAFEWYGDASRATELARLNPSLRESNNLQPGDVLYAWAK